MECKKFNYKGNKECSFRVGSYRNNPDCMAIQMLDNKGEVIYTCTTNMPEYMYYSRSTTIKNYMENSGMTDFLLKLGVIEEIITRKKVSIYATKKFESIDFCFINLEKLKKYTSVFDYEYDDELEED